MRCELPFLIIIYACVSSHFVDSIPTYSLEPTAYGLSGALMGDMLSSATSGLLAFQRALDTTSHNIANVGTDGYSRQRVLIGTRLPQPYSTGFVGNGASVQTIERLFDRYVAEETRN